MNITKHAAGRLSQRGIPQSIFEIVLEHGSLEYAPGGVYRVVFRRKDRQEVMSLLKKAMHLVERAKDGVLVLDEDSIITAYKRQ